MVRPSRPEHFRVEEIPLYEPSGEGEHTFVCVEKRLRSTDAVARALARAAGTAPRDVGYAGRKDRFAVATQWFSVPGLDPERALALELPDARVLAASRHRHKLRTGDLRGNRFHIDLQGVSPSDFASARERLARLCRRGLPNRFGAQRFGRDGANLPRARRLLEGASPPRDRRSARFLWSVLQAAVFNDVLAARPAGTDCLEWGDVAVVHATGGLFHVEDPEAEASRLASFAISATGPIFGTRAIEPKGAVAQRERSVLSAYGIALKALRPPPGIRARGARRALRVRPEQARLRRSGEGVRLEFVLPAGSYASVLIEELFDTRGERIG